jgi:hypothetical protein
MKLGYLQDLMYRVTRDEEGQMIASACVSYTLENSPIKIERTILQNALYQTLLRHQQLWCMISSSDLKDGAYRLEDLIPKLDFDTSFDDINPAIVLEDQLNQQFDIGSLGWRLVVHILNTTISNDARHSYKLYFVMTIKHELGDGFSLDSFCDEFIRHLEAMLEIGRVRPVRMSALIPNKTVPVEESYSIHPFKWNLLYWILGYIQAVFVGLYMCLGIGSLAWWKRKTCYYGSKPASMLYERNTGFRVVHVDSTVFSCKDSANLFSVVTVAALGAYSTLACKFRQHTSNPVFHVSFTTLFNARLRKGVSVESAIYPITWHYYPFFSTKSFQIQVEELKSKVADRYRYIGAYIRTMRWLPTLLSSFFVRQQSVYDKRDISFTILDQRQPLVEPFRFTTKTWVCSSINSFWTGNRSLFHITICQGNHTKALTLGIAYAAHQLTEKEVDVFVHALKTYLLRCNSPFETTLMKDLTPKEELLLIRIFGDSYPSP